MARYEYETSPRKIETEYHKKKKKISKVTKVEIKKKNKVVQVLKVLAIFLVLLTISYRNSLINEKFTDIKDMKKELATLEKENEQLEVKIESEMNLNTVEQKAKDEYGMVKQTKEQTRYVNIEKQDFVEASSDEEIIKDNESFMTKLIKIVTNL